ncbi:MAG: amidohydrolase [Firmicutes bacterium]|nr:amidohydrolase [Bacillota bacterium]
MKQISQDVLQTKIDQIYPQVVTARRHIHQHPELSGHEEKTCQYIIEQLSAMGIEANPIAGTGVLALIQGQGAGCDAEKRTVAIRADIDALPIMENTGLPFSSQNPGVMHACGHDVHASILLGTAALLHSMRDEFIGAVKLFFQPNEEAEGGAAPMIAEGCMENPKVDAVLGLHVTEALPVGSIELCRGTMNAATCELKIKVMGKSCHGAHPEGGVDAIIIAANVITALQTIITRNLAPTDPLIITLGTIHGGAKENVVAGEVMLTGTLRSLTLAHRDFAQKRIQEICEGVAAAYGGSCQVEFINGYPPLDNNDDLVDLLADLGKQFLGSENVRYLPAPSLGADDFAYFCQAAPSVYFNIGTAAPTATNPAPIHNEAFCPDEEAMKVGILMETAAALKLLQEGL